MLIMDIKHNVQIIDVIETVIESLLQHFNNIGNITLLIMLSRYLYLL